MKVSGAVSMRRLFSADSLRSDNAEGARHAAALRRQSPVRSDRKAFEVAGLRLHAHDGALVELGDGAGTGVGAGAAHPGHDLVDDVLDARVLGVDVHARRADALLEELLAGPFEARLVAGAMGHGPL